MADDQWLIMSDRCPAVRCAPERQAGPASEDSCSKIQVLNANGSVLNALHPRYPRRKGLPRARGGGFLPFLLICRQKKTTDFTD
jgi:hypothetical protein